MVNKRVRCYYYNKLFSFNKKIKKINFINKKMQTTHFSFGTLFDQSQISKIPTPITQKKNPCQQQSYQQKYHQCKQNIKQFMQMVQKQFQDLGKKHNTQKQSLKQQITKLKQQLNHQNDVSSFTVRSKRVNHTGEKSLNKDRSMPQQANQQYSMIFEGISHFDQSKIHSRSKSIVDKNLSSISNPNTLVQLQNAFNEKNSSRISSRTTSAMGNLDQNSINNSNSMNVSQYTNQILGKKLKNYKDSQKKENFNALMEKMIEKNINSQAQKDKAKFFETNEPTPTEQPALSHRNNKNKENLSSDTTNRNDQKSKTQETSVRNILKNLRSSMKNNIEKQSNLQAITISIKS